MAIGNVGGFSQGFTQGFGLVRDTLNQQRRNRLQEEDIEFRREQAGLAEQERTDARKFRQDQALLSAEDRLLNKKAREDEAKFRREQKSRADEKSLADDEVRKAQLAYYTSRQGLLEDQRDRENKADEKFQRTLQQGKDAQNLYDYLNDVRGGLVEFDAKTASELYEPIAGTPMDFGSAIDPSNENVLQAFGRELQKMQVGEQFDEQPIVDAANHMLTGSTRKGMTVTAEDYPNAPKAYTGGNYVIKDRKIDALKIVGVDNPDENSVGMPKRVRLSGDVVVTVQNKATGEEAYYIAPATEGRSPVGAMQEFFADEMIRSYGGRIEFEKAVKPFERDLIRMKREMYTDKSGNYSPRLADAAEDAVIADLRDQVEAFDLGDKASPLGISYNELLGDPVALTRYAQQKAHFGRVGSREDDLSINSVLATIRESEPYKQLSRDKKAPLSRREELELASILTLRNGKIAIEENDLFNELRNKVRNRNIGEESFDVPEVRGTFGGYNIDALRSR